jgi:hypothetical protein
MRRGWNPVRGSYSPWNENNYEVIIKTESKNRVAHKIRAAALSVNILDLPLHRCRTACQLFLQNAQQRLCRGVAKTTSGMCKNVRGYSAVRHTIFKGIPKMCTITTETFWFQNVMSLYSSQIIIKMHESQKNKFDNNSVYYLWEERQRPFSSLLRATYMNFSFCQFCDFFVFLKIP